MLGWPEICKLAHAFLWEYSYKRLKLAQRLGQLDVFLTWCLIWFQAWPTSRVLSIAPSTSLRGGHTIIRRCCSRPLRRRSENGARKNGSTARD
jgi:hypothetical protein